MKKGFTLIELLVVISIIGILAGMTLVSYSGAQKQTRDTERRSDLAQYRNGLANYAANNDGLYPITGDSDIGPASALCGVLRPDYISSCPTDPSENTYNYETDGTGVNYVLWVQLETGGYWEVCSTGEAGKYDTGVPDDSNCDL
jgi:prepilin-type N-terminal cleavage/methylation domain-containing protein